MDNKRLFLACAISMAIILGFEWLMPKQTPQQLRHHETAAASAPGTSPGPAVTDPLTPGAHPAPVAAPGPEHRLPVEAPAVYGSINLQGAKLDDLLLRDYRETVDRNSPHVRVLEPRSAKQPNLVQLGWSAAPGGGAKLPGDDTVWTADVAKLTPATPVTLSWDNGAGLVFTIRIAVDAEYMFDVRQEVRNSTAQPVALFPWSRVDRGYTPAVTGGYLVHEGPIAVTDGHLEEMSYSAVKSGAAKNDGTAWSGGQAAGERGGWGGITDKYWLTAVLPDRGAATTANYRFDPADGAGTYQVDFIPRAAAAVAPNGSLATESHVFAGAKEVHLLERYQAQEHAADFWKAVDFGWFAFLTRPIFYVLDWLNTVLGNFGLALLAFTLIVKTLFFPLATKQFRSMAKMKLLAPKLAAVRERHKGDPMALNQEMMGVYKQEGVNPAAGCLPMLVQVPVFWCLYKDLIVTIEMRQAPFFGWIRDLSEPDPTNLFNLFGLVPFDPAAISPILHLGVWPIVLGGTMLLMQRMNPPPADPAQARLFQIMPLFFMFILARQPAGLVIYYCWNNLLTVTQQWIIQRRIRIGGGGARQVGAMGR